MPRHKKNKKNKIEELLRLIDQGRKVIPSCPDFGTCGGCSLLNISYEDELMIKQKMVARLMAPFFVGEISIVSSPNVIGYRNKMELSFGDYSNEGGLALGIRNRNRYYEVTVPTHCMLIPEDFKAIAMSTLEYFSKTDEIFYHRKRHTGTLRYLVLRRGEFTGEILVNLVTTTALDNSHPEKWVKNLLALPLDGKIVGLLHTKSDSLSDAVVPEHVKTLWGRDCFYEKLCGLTFGISPFSFFQTNSAGAELLYSTVAEFAGQSDRICDCYCGTGTIALILADSRPDVKEVVGIELVAEAVAAATENARINRIDNCRFIMGDVLKVLEKQDFSPDVLVLDPPRDGIHPKALNQLVSLDASKVVYVSCKPASLARDLPFFIEKGYEVEKLRLHDMFPRTPHIETVCLLKNTYKRR